MTITFYVVKYWKQKSNLTLLFYKLLVNDEKTTCFYKTLLTDQSGQLL